MDSDQASIPIPNPSLNVDVIIEILSWLPVLALLRFKLVCKEWKHVIEGETLKLKHYARSIGCVCLENQRELPDEGIMVNDTYQCLGIYYGMIVERSVGHQKKCQRKYRIRNPALRLVIELPNPREGVLGMFLSHLPSPGDFKLISLHKNGKEAGIGCEILGLDGNANPSWRKLMSFPDLSHLGRQLKPSFVSIGKVVHCILLAKPSLEILMEMATEMCMHILSVDIEKEDFLGIISPKFRHPDIYHMEPFLYNGELGFAQIVTTGIQVYTLANCKDIVKKVVLPLNFFTAIPEMRSGLMIGCVEGSEIWFNWGMMQLFVYDTVLGRITRSKDCQHIEWYGNEDGYGFRAWSHSYAYPLKPSLFAIKGMGPTKMTTPNHYMELEVFNEENYSSL